ncbi:MAG: hypothetical protein A3G75_03935 [Verrucomicrobia bacterium RIFCSPLOWO2_12_FULL_64_8]|nr:MAG: hypothetical protein A3G75_03935 [Verrucomicrobia bacterium RIFCSPLOWO2_12_FULL_64_8]
MRLTACGLLGLILPVLVIAAETPRITSGALPAKLKFGDDPRWAAPDWDDRDWEQTTTADLPSRAGIYWIRLRLSWPTRGRVLDPLAAIIWHGDPPAAPIDSLFLAAVFSFELYWDGRLLERSGVVGSSRETEATGPLDHLVPIPSGLSGPGEHVIALRISSYHYNFPAPSFNLFISLGNYANRLVYEARRAVFPMVGVGGALLVAAICAVLFWFVDRRRPLVLCSLLGFAVAMFYFLIAWRCLHNDPYDWLYPRYVVITALMTLISGLVPWLLLEQFEVPRKGLWLAALAPLLVAPWVASPWYHIVAVWLCRLMLGYSAVVAGWAAWKKRRGAWLVLVGVCVGLVSVRATNTRDFLDLSFFLTFGVLVLSAFTVLGMQIREDRRRAREALLTSARLEAELLKKNIQPHFLLNTLTALSEVVERDPAGAVRLINDLAGEFRSLARMSGEKLVPLGQELELCRAHLRVLSVRTGLTAALETRGVDETVLVPPALFLTLIENGFVHQRPAGNSAAFELHMQRPPGRIRFTFLSPGAVKSEPGRPDGGTGLRYVQARLEESFPRRWTLDQRAISEGWETVIEIQNA